MTSINNQLSILTFLRLPQTSVIANHFPLGNLVHVASEIPLGLRIPHCPLLRVLSWFLLNLQSLDVGAPQGLVLRCFVACLHYTLGEVHLSAALGSESTQSHSLNKHVLGSSLVRSYAGCQEQTDKLHIISAFKGGEKHVFPLHLVKFFSLFKAQM